MAAASSFEQRRIEQFVAFVVRHELLQREPRAAARRDRRAPGRSPAKTPRASRAVSSSCARVAVGERARAVASTWSRSMVPSMLRALASSTLPPPKAMSWSSSDSASRMLPSAACATRRSAGRRRVHLLGVEHLAQVLADQRHRQALEIELQAARQHRDRQLLRIGGREQELHVRRRLFERLQQRVERVRRQHVHFVDEVDLVAAARGRVLHVLEQLARVIDLGARRGVDFDEVDEAALVDLLAGAHLPQGVAVTPVSQLRHFGEDARDGGLADAARAGEQEGVMHAALRQRIAQRLRTCSWPTSSAKDRGRHLRASAR